MQNGNKKRIAVLVGLVVLLACVRAFEDVLFYDPLLDYYKSDFTSLPWPEMNLFWLALSLFFRYSLNTILSLAIIYTLFKSGSLVRFTAILYTLFFIVLIIVFFVTMAVADDDKMLVFYIRRFIIQPIFLLLFVPAFYFQQLASKKNNVS
jgi:exosortase F-associated protein